MLRYKIEIAWFSHLVWRLARKWSGSILTTPEPARGNLYLRLLQFRQNKWKNAVQKELYEALTVDRKLRWVRILMAVDNFCIVAESNCW